MRVQKILFVLLPPRTSNKSENGTESKLDKSSILNAGKVDLSLSKVLKNIKGRIPTQTQKDTKKDDKPEKSDQEKFEIIGGVVINKPKDDSNFKSKIK